MENIYYFWQNLRSLQCWLNLVKKLYLKQNKDFRFRRFFLSLFLILSWIREKFFKINLFFRQNQFISYFFSFSQGKKKYKTFFSGRIQFLSRTKFYSRTKLSLKLFDFFSLKISEVKQVSRQAQLTIELFNYLLKKNKITITRLTLNGQKKFPNKK